MAKFRHHSISDRASNQPKKTPRVSLMSLPREVRLQVFSELLKSYELVTHIEVHNPSELEPSHGNSLRLWDSDWRFRAIRTIWGLHYMKDDDDGFMADMRRLTHSSKEISYELYYVLFSTYKIVLVRDTSELLLLQEFLQVIGPKCALVAKEIEISQVNMGQKPCFLKPSEGDVENWRRFICSRRRADIDTINSWKRDVESRLDMVVKDLERDFNLHPTFKLMISAYEAASPYFAGRGNASGRVRGLRAANYVFKVDEGRLCFEERNDRGHVFLLPDGIWDRRCSHSHQPKIGLASFEI